MAIRKVVLGAFFAWISSLGLAQKTATQQTLVQNAGVPGQNSAEGRARFEKEVVSLHPQIVLIYFGMNDAVNEAKMLPLEKFLENMEWMVDSARGSGIVPVLTTIQHVDSERLLKRHPASVYGTEGPNGRIDRFNAGLLELAQKKSVALVDFNTTLDRAGGPVLEMSTDGVHLTAKGYALLAKSFYEAIPATGEKPRQIVALGDSLTFGTPLRTVEHESDETYPAVLQGLLNKSAPAAP
jgi:lysophospholipase L1-like esterase